MLTLLQCRICKSIGRVGYVGFTRQAGLHAFVYAPAQIPLFGKHCANSVKPNTFMHMHEPDSGKKTPTSRMPVEVWVVTSVS